MIISASNIFVGDASNEITLEGAGEFTNFGINDTLQMTAGRTISTQVSGNDVIVTLKGASYNVVETLLGTANLPLKVKKFFRRRHYYN